MAASPTIIGFGARPVKRRRFVDQVTWDMYLFRRYTVVTFVLSFVLVLGGRCAYGFLSGQGLDGVVWMGLLQAGIIAAIFTVIGAREPVAKYVKDNPVFMKGESRLMADGNGTWLEQQPDDNIHWSSLSEVERRGSFFLLGFRDSTVAYIPFDFFLTEEEIDYFESVATQCVAWWKDKEADG